MTQANDEIHGVILSGGGAYGAFEVGVMKALFSGDSPVTGYTPLDAAVFTGTSVGAFNAAAMTMEPNTHSCATIAHLEEIWINDITDNPQTCGNGVFRFRGNALRYMEPECITTNPVEPLVALGGDAAFFAEYLFRRGTNFLFSSGNLPHRALQFIDLSALISIEPFKRLIEKMVRLEAIRSSDKLLRIVATNWETGEVKIFENKDMNDGFGRQIIMASAAIPGIFPPVNIAGDMYVDGGVVMNTPLKCAIQAGATTLHVIYLDPDVQNIPLRRLQNSLDTLDRVFTIALATKTNEDIDTARWINDGLEVIERTSRGQTVPDADMRMFIGVAARIKERIEKGSPYRKLTIHRYHPKDDLGGTLGMLNFNQEPIRGFIQRGFMDAAEHDCSVNHCVLP
jgi:predicted acylesterase/phospholipase RssA